jgi:hypothetical protein
MNCIGQNIQLKKVAHWNARSLSELLHKLHWSVALSRTYRDIGLHVLKTSHEQPSSIASFTSCVSHSREGVYEALEA